MSWRNPFSETLGKRLYDLGEAVVAPQEHAGLDDAIASRARAEAPVVWLVGKLQSGKSSIVRALTGFEDAEVGSGFRACTTTAKMFDFPREAPIIRFLDTRGLEEFHYDPSADIAVCAGHAQVILVVIKALDHEQTSVLKTVRAARQRYPRWPIIVAQTALHEGYPTGAGHPANYSFGPDGMPLQSAAVPPDLKRSLALQRRLFDAVPGDGPIKFVPLDFTQAEDGYQPLNYGLDALIDALREVVPEAVIDSLESSYSNKDVLASRSHPHIVGYSIAAAAADVVPLAGIVAVPGVQAKMLHSLFRIYGISWTRRAAVEFVAALGLGTTGRTLAVFASRELAKLIPVYGQTAGAAAAAGASFATTYALGKAACAYLRGRRRGIVDRAAISGAFREALTEALRLRAKQQGNEKA